MKLVQINMSSYGSTGKIVKGISNLAEENGIENRFYVPKSITEMKRKDENKYLIGTIAEHKIHNIYNRYTSRGGTLSFIGTHDLIRKLKEFNPDIIHLHNLHNNYLNFDILFSYIKENNISIVWTLHDCWSFTGGCPHFVLKKCNKWKTLCKECSYQGYPVGMRDSSTEMYIKKKRWFTGIKNCVIVSPSQWLADLVAESFLKEYEIRVINNGINLNIFHPQISSIREKYNIQHKFVILGVAFSWEYRKGLDVFERLSKDLPEEFQIVLIGVTEEMQGALPSNIIAICRTADQLELAQWYTTADVFLNPTREDTFPTVNIEALACGTPVLTFDTGGSAECLNKNVGRVINEDDIFDVLLEIKKRNYKSIDCVEKGLAYSEKDKFEAYIKLYHELVDDAEE